MFLHPYNSLIVFPLPNYPEPHAILRGEVKVKILLPRINNLKWKGMTAQKIVTPTMLWGQAKKIFSPQ